MSGLAVLAFLVSLAASLPVRLAAAYVAPATGINGYSGTVWRGQARLPGGHAVDWQVDALASLAAQGVAADIEVSGPGTHLAGRVTLRGLAGHDLRVVGLTGSAAWPLVAAVAPVPGIACDGRVVVEGVELAVAPGLRRGAGRLVSGPATCARSGAEPVPVPPLAARLKTVAEGLRATLARPEAPDMPLAEATATTDDRLIVRVTAEGAGLVPGMPTSGETALEYPFPWPP